MSLKSRVVDIFLRTPFLRTSKSLQGLKPWLFMLLNVAVEAATHKSQ